MYAVAGGEMAFTRFFQPRFEFAHGGVSPFEFVHCLLDFVRQPFTFVLRLLPAQEPQHVLLAGQFFLQLPVLPGDTGLAFETLHLRRQFETDVFDAGQVLARIGQPALGFLAPFLVARHAGGFFEKNAQFVRPGFDQARDRSLTDDRVRAWSETGTEKQVGDVAPADVQIVDVILGLTVARQQALDRQFGVLRPLAAQAAERVVEDQLDGGA